MDNKTRIALSKFFFCSGISFLIGIILIKIGIQLNNKIISAIGVGFPLWATALLIIIVAIKIRRKLNIKMEIKTKKENEK